MAAQISHRTDRLLIKLDRLHGMHAVHHRFGPQTVDVVTGVPSQSDEQTPVIVRSVGMSSFDIAEIMSSGLGQIDAGWQMRYAYLDEIQDGDVLSISAFDYEVIDRGAFLDSLNLLWTIFTRRRP